MTRPADIPEAVLMRAGALLDAHPQVKDTRTLVALAFMESDRCTEAHLGLTQQQRATLDFIEAYQQRHRVSPTFEEIRLHLGLASKSAVHRLVQSLEDRGAIKRLPYRGRSIAICGRVDDVNTAHQKIAEVA